MDNGIEVRQWADMFGEWLVGKRAENSRKSSKKCANITVREELHQNRSVFAKILPSGKNNKM